jgi:hypothetical protein
MSNVYYLVTVQDFLSLKEFLKEQPFLVPFAVMDDVSDLKMSKFSLISHKLQTVFLLESALEDEINTITEMLHELKIPIVEGISERI